MTQSTCDDLMSELNKSCADKTTSAPIAEIRIEQRTEAMYYRTTSSSFLKIYVDAQEKMKKVIDAMSKVAGGEVGEEEKLCGLKWPAGSEAWETNISGKTSERWPFVPALFLVQHKAFPDTSRW